MQDEILKDFYLAGGTALALQVGHRISIDLDFFTIAPFDESALLGLLEENYKFQVDFQSKNTLKGFINETKVDFLAHQYPLVKPLLIIEDVKMASPEDIAAMKLNAIVSNGSRLKDFIDVAYLSSTLTLTQMVDAYEEKYVTRNPTIALKSLAYQNDIDFTENIQMLDGEYKWEDIQERLSKIIDSPDQLL
jgi:hypothetical protein